MTPRDESMASPPAIQQPLEELSDLVEALDDRDAGMAVVRADGRWHLERDGALRGQSVPLDEESASRLVRTVHYRGGLRCLDSWWVHPLSGDLGGAVVFERRPSSTPDGFSRRSLELFHSRLRPGANGLIFGNSRHARSGLLLSLVRQLPAGLIIYVGPVPPIVSDESAVQHVAPPQDDRDRRRLATLFDRASAVLFDGPICRADVRLLFSGETITDRWLTADASSPANWASSFGVPDELARPITTRVGVRGSPVQSVRLSYLAVRRGEDWKVLLDQDDLHGSTGRPVPEKTRPASEFQLEESNMTSSIELNRSNAEDERTTHPETPSKTLGDRDSTAGSFSSDDLDETSRVERPEEVLRADALAALEGEDEEPVGRESGEIEVPGFGAEETTKRRTGGDDSDPEEIRGERIDDKLPGLVASSDIDDIEIPNIAPEQLRRTIESSTDIDVEELQRQRAEQRRKRELETQSIDPPDGLDEQEFDDAGSAVVADSEPDDNSEADADEPDTREVDVPDEEFDEFEGEESAPDRLDATDSEPETDEIDPDRL